MRVHSVTKKKKKGGSREIVIINKAPAVVCVVERSQPNPESRDNVGLRLISQWPVHSSRLEGHG